MYIRRIYGVKHFEIGLAIKGIHTSVVDRFFYVYTETMSAFFGCLGLVINFVMQLKSNIYIYIDCIEADNLE